MIEAFFKEVAESGTVWTIRDEGGFPTSTNAAGETTLPFWSTKSRAQNVIDNVSSYQNFRTEPLALTNFIEAWLPGMKDDGLFVGLNWYGKRATGYNLTPSEILDRLA